jgi:hypothetical protein
VAKIEAVAWTWSGPDDDTVIHPFIAVGKVSVEMVSCG